MSTDRVDTSDVPTDQADEVDVLQNYSSDIVTAVLKAGQDALLHLTMGFESNGMIENEQKISFLGQGRASGTNELFDAIHDHVKKDTHRIRRALDIMEKRIYLKDIVKNMREEYDPVASILIPEYNPPKGLEDTDGGDSKFKVFLSFKWGEGDVLVNHLYDHLKTKSGLDIWKDDRKMSPGQKLKDEIKEGVESCNLFVFLMSPGYFQSRWCKDELKIAVSMGKRLFPIKWVNPNVRYPPDYDHLNGKVYHKYDEKAINMETEKKRCVAKIVECINDINQ